MVKAQLCRQRRASTEGGTQANGGREGNWRSGRELDQGNARGGSSIWETAVGDKRQVAYLLFTARKKRNVPPTAGAGQNVVLLCSLMYFFAL